MLQRQRDYLNDKRDRLKKKRRIIKIAVGSSIAGIAAVGAAIFLGKQSDFSLFDAMGNLGLLDNLQQMLNEKYDWYGEPPDITDVLENWTPNLGDSLDEMEENIENLIEDIFEEQFTEQVPEGLLGDTIVTAYDRVIR